MSVHVSSWAWKQAVGDTTAKFILLKLADNANDQGVAWPHQQTIADECECNVKTVQRAIAKLKALGLLEVVRDASRSGSPNVYRFPLETTRQIVASGNPNTRQDVASLPDNLSSLIDREPSVEPSVDEKLCPQCGLKPPGTTTVTEHLENVHGVRAA